MHMVRPTLGEDHRGCAGAGAWSKRTVVVRAEGLCQETQHMKRVNGGC